MADQHSVTGNVGQTITEVIEGYRVDTREAGRFAEIDINRTDARTSTPVPMYLTREGCYQFAKLFAELGDRMADTPPSTGGLHSPEEHRAIAAKIRALNSAPSYLEIVTGLRRSDRVIGTIGPREVRA